MQSMGGTFVSRSSHDVTDFRQDPPPHANFSTPAYEEVRASQSSQGMSLQQMLPPLLPRVLPNPTNLGMPTRSINSLEPSRKDFEPSSSVKLMPPARRGGRKGRMSEEQKRGRAPNRSVCMRCRKMRIKVRHEVQTRNSQHINQRPSSATEVIPAPHAGTMRKPDFGHNLVSKPDFSK